MPVTRFGEWCNRCSQRPAEASGICRACELLLTAFGHEGAPTTRPQMARFDALVDAGCAHPAESEAFEREFNAWRGG